jgi:hypothetical protein
VERLILHSRGTFRHVRLLPPTHHQKNPQQKESSLSVVKLEAKLTPSYPSALAGKFGWVLARRPIRNARGSARAVTRYGVGGLGAWFRAEGSSQALRKREEVHFCVFPLAAYACVWFRPGFVDVVAWVWG